ncbi:hypothetical protein ACQR50_00110 [Sphingomonas sp. Xoc002]|uniref:hypothetical protein n=1 Tax=Sphingomonas sp. Xoc002 TaxID=2837624 RepID=UPI003D170DB2
MMVLLVLAALAEPMPIPAGLAAYVRDLKLTRYDYALRDLNGDGRPEALVYARQAREDGQDVSLCGSGGCDLTILTLTPTGYHAVSDISITRPPIRVLNSSTKGWHDLSVLVSGGGILPGYRVRLRFDGRSYPTNPSVAPTRRLKGQEPAGVTVIDVRSD